MNLFDRFDFGFLIGSLAIGGAALGYVAGMCAEALGYPASAGLLIAIPFNFTVAYICTWAFLNRRVR